MLKVVIPDHIVDETEVENQIFGNDVEVTCYRQPPESLEYLRDFDAVMHWHHFRVNEETLAYMDKCKCVVRFGAGLDNVDQELCERQNIRVFNVPDYGVDEVADHTLALILGLSRSIVAHQNDHRAWVDQYEQPNIRLQGKTAGIIGLGRIGLAVARRLQAFGMNILFYDPYVEEGIEKSLGFERTTNINKIAAASSVITLHVPLTEETHHMINDDFLHWVNKAPIFVNTCRGGVVDYDALIEAHKAGKFQGLGIDVFETEPPMNLYRDNRIIYTPHSAFYSDESIIELRSKAARKCLECLKER